MAILKAKMPEPIVAANSAEPVQADSAQGKTSRKLNKKEVKGIVSVAGLVIRLTVVLVPLSFLGWAGFRRVRPMVRSIRRRRKPAYRKKGIAIEQEGKAGGKLFGRKGKKRGKTS